MAQSPLRDFVLLRIFDDAWSRLVCAGVLPRRWQMIRRIRRGYKKFLGATEGDPRMFSARLFVKKMVATELLNAADFAEMIRAQNEQDRRQNHPLPA